MKPTEPLKIPSNLLKSRSTSIPQRQTYSNYSEDSFSKTGPHPGTTKYPIIKSSKLENNFFPGQLHVGKIGMKK